MYLTNLDTTPGGKFHGPMVVSMRPIPAGQVADAVRITSQYPAVGARPRRGPRSNQVPTSPAPTSAKLSNARRELYPCSGVAG